MKNRMTDFPLRLIQTNLREIDMADIPQIPPLHRRLRAGA